MTVLNLRGQPVPDGGRLQITEADHLTFSVRDSTGRPMLRIADELVPLVERQVGEWVADPDWVHHAASSHLVGECPITLHTPDGTLCVAAILDRAPSRVTSEQYAYLLEAITSRTGTTGIEDPFGRAQIWFDMAPHVPSLPEERARMTVELWRRSATALRNVAFSPTPVLRPDPEWIDITRLRGVPARSLSPRHMRPWDPPRPLPRPTSGLVLLERVEESFDTPENRFVARVARLLAHQLVEIANDPPVTSRIATTAQLAADELTTWFSRPPWRTIAAGTFPAQSFLIRDHADYHTVARLHRLLSDLPGALLAFPPTDRAYPVSPWSLNVLYQTWIGVLVAEWLETRLGRLNRAAVPARGTFAWNAGDCKVILRLDHPYPRRASSGVICPTGKNRPDVAIEVWAPGRTAALAVLDATYSTNPALHEEKLGYSDTLVDIGSRSPLTGRPSPCVQWAAVAFPGPTPQATERRAQLAETLLTLPPSDDAAALVGAWLDATLGDLLTL